MKKLRTAADERKKQKRNNIIISGVLIFVISASIFGIVATSFGSDSSSDPNSVSIDYNGYKFVANGGYWNLNAGDLTFTFKHTPYESNELGVNASNLNSLTFYSQKPLYLYSEDSPSTSEIYSNVIPYVSRAQLACYDEEHCNGDFPIKNCEDNFIIIRKSETPKVFQNESCLYIEGPEENLTKLTDLFLFKALGIED
ncbi:MAG: hypothetical protein KC516_03895 [Nanoarchaeota archaeon]|nr:hypothetical protein [Nanoarchaeota archaeon]